MSNQIIPLSEYLRFLTKKISALTSVLILCAATSGCGRSDNRTADSSLPTVTVSIPPLEYFAYAIGGDSINVTTLLPAGADPETFDPGTSTMRALGKSGALAVTGKLPFETSLMENLRANNSDLHLYDMGEGISPVYGTHSHHSAEESGNHHHDKTDIDPHIWSSVRNASVIADNMLAALIDIAPRHSAYYRARHAVLTHRLDSLDSSLSQRLGSMPSRSFLIWHPSLSYFSRDYNLEQIALNAENKENSSQQFLSVLSKARTGKPAAFIVPEGIDRRQTEAVTSATGLQPVSVNLMSADWENSITSVVDALTATK